MAGMTRARRRPPETLHRPRNVRSRTTAFGKWLASLLDGTTLWPATMGDVPDLEPGEHPDRNHVAQALHISEPYLRQIARGAFVPSWRMQASIEAATGGAVPVSSWPPRASDPAARRAAR